MLTIKENKDTKKSKENAKFPGNKNFCLCVCMGERGSVWSLIAFEWGDIFYCFEAYMYCNRFYCFGRWKCEERRSKEKDKSDVTLNRKYLHFICLKISFKKCIMRFFTCQPGQMKQRCRLLEKVGSQVYRILKCSLASWQWPRLPLGWCEPDAAIKKSIQEFSLQ